MQVKGHLLSSNKILKIISCRNALGFGSSEEVLHHRISVVPKADFNRAIKSMDISAEDLAILRI